MIMQSNENILARPTGCENAESGNRLREMAREAGCIRVFASVNSELIALVDYRTSDTYIELDFCPLDKWVSDCFEQADISTVYVDFMPQERMVGDRSTTALPGEFRYDIDNEVSEVLSNLSDYYPSTSIQVERKEVGHVG
ncbi:hypothetical protein [Sphingobacterium kyonggiense]